jgi:hypothetical protein
MNENGEICEIGGRVVEIESLLREKEVGICETKRSEEVESGLSPSAVEASEGVEIN